MSNLTIRDARPEDCSALAAMDLTYESRRMLVIERAGDAAEVAWTARWRDTAPAELNYATYTEHGLQAALTKVDRFLVALSGDAPAGLLMILKPPWTDAGEITDFAIDRAHRRSGAGTALLAGAIGHAREQGLRSLWVEPRADNDAAIAFYLARGFRISGFNDRMYSNDDDAPGRTTLFMHREITDKD
jgi:ribosomal protein S18 acetylase RimI-like enzyme